MTTILYFFFFQAASPPPPTFVQRISHRPHPGAPMGFADQGN